MKLVWCVKSELRTLIWETYFEAWLDYNQYKHSIIYPTLISKKKFNSLKEFNG